MSLTDADTHTPVATLQTDSFCEGCGYNLHSQVVTRDERLGGMLVCRCPECGRWSAAGHGSTVGRVWVNRAATAVVFSWALCLLGLFAFFALMMGVMPSAHLDAFTDYQWATLNQPGVTPNAQVPRRTVHVDVPGSEADASNRTAMCFFIGFAAAFGLVTGACVAVFLWHLKGVVRLVALIPVLVGTGGTALIWVMRPDTVGVRGWGLQRAASYALLEAACAIAGLALGRPIARGILRALLPPRLLQHLAFLWFTDGKRPPAAGGSESPEVRAAA